MERCLLYNTDLSLQGISGRQIGCNLVCSPKSI